MDTLKHSEDKIYKIKAFVKELNVVQDTYFESLCEDLGMTDEGRDWLFDYIFNNSEPETFEEYLIKCDKTFGELK